MSAWPPRQTDGKAVQQFHLVFESHDGRALVRCQPDSFSISVSDSGDGPAAGHTDNGLGTMIVETLCRQINASVEKERLVDDYTVTIKVPHQKVS